MSHENYKFMKMIEYIENLELESHEEMDKFNPKSNDNYIYIPIDPLSNHWAEIDDQLPEDIFSSCENLIKELEKDLERATKANEKKNIKGAISYYEKDLRKGLDKCHEEFFKELNKEYEKVEGARKTIFDYCLANKRLAKKQTYWPKELLDFAKNLEKNTIPKKEKKAK